MAKDLLKKIVDFKPEHKKKFKAQGVTLDWARQEYMHNYTHLKAGGSAMCNRCQSFQNLLGSIF